MHNCQLPLCLSGQLLAKGQGRQHAGEEDVHRRGEDPAVGQHKDKSALGKLMRDGSSEAVRCVAERCDAPASSGVSSFRALTG